MGGSVILLWAIGVGSVIGGDFFGWSYLLSSGIGGSIVSFAINMAMYYYLAQAVSTLSTSIKKSGGADVYVTEGIGQTFGLITASLETAKIILTTCAIANGTVNYFLVLVGIESSEGAYLSYLGLFIIFGGVNMLGTSFSGTFQIIVTCFSLLVLLFYWISICTTIDFNRYAIEDGSWFVGGLSGFALAQPFAAWLFFGFEELPLVQSSIPDNEEPSVQAHQPSLNLSFLGKNSFGSINDAGMNRGQDSANSNAILGFEISNRLSLPTIISASVAKKGNGDMAMLLSFLTVAASGILTVLLAASANPGAQSLASDNSPLIAGMEGVYGDSSWVVMLVNILVIIALVTPFNAFLLYAAHHMCHQAHHDQLPSWFGRDKLWISNSQNTKPFQASDDTSDVMPQNTDKLVATPTNAVLAVGFLGLLVVIIMTVAAGIEDTGNILVSASLFPAMCSYYLQLESLHRLQAKQATSRNIGSQSTIGTTTLLTMTESSALHSNLISSSRAVDTVDNGSHDAPSAPDTDPESRKITNLEIRVGQFCVLVNIVCLIYAAVVVNVRLVGILVAVFFSLGTFLAMIATRANNLAVAC